MTYNVFGGTLCLTQSINQYYSHLYDDDDAAAADDDDGGILERSLCFDECFSAEVITQLAQRRTPVARIP